ncbi:MAG TPA: TetR/AcrR family transcriptional regulator [Aggregatilineales bacterium]|nr:TetR/AcrR family transcriptional regulator [Aggregatilineales bacterium]
MDKVDKVDPRVRRTRQMLQQAMTELLREKEFVDITVQDIAEGADLNRATFYKHFLDKYDLLNVIVRERFQTLLDAALPENPGLSPETVGILIQTAYDYLAGFHDRCIKVQSRDEQALIMQQVQRQIYDNLLLWLQECAAHSGLKRKAPELTALLTSWMIFGPILQVVWGTPKLPKQTLIDEVTALVRSALEDYLIAA